MSSERPVNLSFGIVIKQPFVALASITHRITGVALFGGIGFLLWWLDQALDSPAGFAAVAASGNFKVLVWLILVALSYHFFAGIKHLLLDMHIADTVPVQRVMTFFSVGLAFASAVLWGLWIW